MRTLLLCTVLALGGCASLDRHSVLPPVTAKIPQSLKQACPGVVTIPERDLTEADVARLWAKDRTSLATCARRHGALAKAASVLEDSK
ncbi:dehydrogenase [Mesorhizobium sp. CA8]|uniref:dehydrogenase n=1 Tax=Mesorhizobium sp. CA8 TaxID=2876637 RepID=UPI001CCC78C5|nr:dehydrogenase [Mesorhizobium sp. CA8]MBZ9759512.1 dehydrogenase [Mesorhizobium sp. CA8]